MDTESVMQCEARGSIEAVNLTLWAGWTPWKSLDEATRLTHSNDQPEQYKIGFNNETVAYHTIIISPNPNHPQRTMALVLELWKEPVWQ